MLQMESDGGEDVDDRSFKNILLSKKFGVLLELQECITEETVEESDK